MIVIIFDLCERLSLYSVLLLGVYTVHRRSMFHNREQLYHTMYFYLFCLLIIDGALDVN